MAKVCRKRFRLTVCFMGRTSSLGLQFESLATSIIRKVAAMPSRRRKAVAEVATAVVRHTLRAALVELHAGWMFRN